MKNLNQSNPTQAMGDRVFSFPLVYGILFAGVALRLAGLNASALWYDEAFSLVITRQGLFEMVRSLATNISPPGWEILLWFVTRLIGYTELSARIIPLLASVATLWVAYRLTHEFGLSPAQQIVALALLALLPYQFWIAHESRMYAVYSLLYTLGVLWAFQGRWIGLGAVMGLMLWFHNTAVFYIPALLLVALLWHPRKWKSIVGVALLPAISWALWWPVFLYQAQGQIPGFPPFTLSHFATNLAGAFFADTLKEGWQFFGFLAVLLSSLAAIWKTLRLGWAWLTRRKVSANESDPVIPLTNLSRETNSAILLMLAVLFPLVLLALFAILFQNVLWYRTLSPLIPCWVLWLSPTLAFQQSGRKALTLVRVILPALWTWVMIAALVGWSPVSRGSNLHEIVSLIRSEWQPGDIVYHGTGTTAVLFDFYLPDAPHFLLNENSVVGSAITEVVKINAPEAGLENIPYHRAWIVWSHDEVTQKMKERVDERMAGYVKNCQIVGRMLYWQHWTTEIYLCRKVE